MRRRAPVGDILIHKAYVKVFGEVFFQAFKHCLGLRETAGQYEVPHDDAACRHAFFIADEKPYLIEHLPDTTYIDAGIIRHGRKRAGFCVVRVFGIDKIEIYYAFKQCDDLRAFIAGAVIDERYTQALCCGDTKRLEYLGNKMGRGDEVDVMAASMLQVEHYLCKALHRYGRADALLAKTVVLAIDATSRAAAKKYDAGPVGAAQRRLLAVMRIVMRDA